jgi:hypothetical protein
MRHLKRVCVGLVLLLALSVSTFAGQTPCGGITEPPPETAEATTEADGQIEIGFSEAVMAFLLSVF